MSQILVMPINNAIITATYKTDAYLQRFGVLHYGVDMYSNISPIVYACGNGTVVCAGKDSVVGNTVVIKYNDVWDGHKSVNVVARCYHMKDNSLRVKVGQKVNKDTILGYFGATGRYVNGAHLHIEFDTDWESDHWKGVPKLYPSPSTFFYAGSDSMEDPCILLHPYTKDNQKIVWSDSKYNGKPYVIKKGFTPTSTLIHQDDNYKKLYENEVKAHNETKKKLASSLELNKKLKSDVDKLQINNENLKKLNDELNNKNKNLNDDIRKYQQDIVELTTKIEFLESQMQSMQVTIDKLQSTLKDKENTIDDLILQVQEYELSSSEKDNEIEKLKESLKNKETEVKDLHKKLAELSVENDKLKISIKDLNESNDDLSKTISEISEELVYRTQLIESFKKSLTNLFNYSD